MINRLGVLVALTFVLITATTARASTIADTGQTTGGIQFTILQQPAGTVTINGSGQDMFTYLVPGTPFGNTPVTASFTLSATSNQTGSCNDLGCPGSDGFVEQGYTGTFSYKVVGGAFNGDNLLSGTFNTNATPIESGGKFSSSIGGTSGGFSGTQSPTDPNGILFTSDFLNFVGVTVEAGSWGLSSVSPSFSVDITATQNSLPTLGTFFTASNAATFSSNEVPAAIPEPVTILLLGSSLVGLGLIRRKRLLRLSKSA